LVFEARKRNADKPLEVLITTDLYVFRRSSGTVTLLTTGIFSQKAHSPSLSGDGRFLSFVFRGINKGEKVPDGLIVTDLKLDRWVKVVNGTLSNPVFSHDGQFIAFESDQPTLAAGAKGKVLNIFLVKNPFYEP
jgi:Tol biopolymer transport system component